MCIYNAHKNALEAHFIMTLRHLITQLCELNNHNSDWLLVNWCFFSGCMKSVLDFWLLITQYLRTQVHLLAQSRQALRSAWAAHFCLKTYTQPCIMLLYIAFKLGASLSLILIQKGSLIFNCIILATSSASLLELVDICNHYAGDLTNIVYSIVYIVMIYKLFIRLQQ